MSDNRVYLRALEPEDYKVSVMWRQDPEIWNMLAGTRYFVSEAYEKKWVEDTIYNTKDIKLAVCLVENNLYIGNVYATDFNMINRTCTTHVLIGNKRYWRNGYACEAYSLLLDFIFNERGINRAQAKVLNDNIASLKMHEKCGYKIDGVLREAVFKNGRYKNLVIMSILQAEYKTIKGRR